MAKVKSKAPKQKCVIPEKVEMQLRRLIRRINVVECTAVCVEKALLERGFKPEREIAVCLEYNIANELSRISHSAAALMAALGLEPPVPEVESSLLGMRIRSHLEDPVETNRTRPAGVR